MQLSIKALARQTSIFGLFQILQRAISFAVTPLYTHFLTPEQFGSLDILYLMVWFVGIVGGSKLDAAFIRYYADAKSDGTLSSLLSSSVIALAGFATLFCVSAALAAEPILRFMFSSSSVPAIGFYLALTATWLELVGSLPLAYLRINQQARLVGTITLVRALIATAIGLGCVTRMHWGIEGILLGAVIAGLFLVLTGYRVVLQRERITFDTTYGLVLYRYALPMLPAPLFMYLLNYADRFFLAKYWSLKEVGIYGMGYKFAMLLSLVVMGPFGEMWGSSQFALYAAGKKNTYRRIALLYVSLLYFVALCVTYSSYEITLVAFDRSYHGLTDFVAPLVVGVAIWGIVPTLDFGCLVHNKTWIRSFTTGAAAAINILLNFLLIRKFGAIGAALATLISFIALTVVTYWFNRLLTDYCVDFGKAMLLSLVLLPLACLVYVGQYLSYGVFLGFRVVALCGFALLLLHVNEIRSTELIRYFSRKGFTNG